MQFTIGSFCVDKESPIFSSPMGFPADLLDRAPLPTASESREWCWLDLGACALDGEIDSFSELNLTTSYVCISVILSTTSSASLFLGSWATP